MKRMLIAGSIVAALVALGALLGRPTDPAPLPDTASPLALRTEAPGWRMPGIPHGCPLAGLAPVRLVREDESLVFDLAEDGSRLSVVFPYGFSGRLVDGRGELVWPGGAVLAREGDVLSGLMGEAASNGDFILCFDAATTVRVESAE